MASNLVKRFLLKMMRLYQTGWITDGTFHFPERYNPRSNSTFRKG